MSLGTLKTLANVGKNISNEYIVPVFKSIEKNKDYEIRVYEKSSFIVYKYRSYESRTEKKIAKKIQENDQVMKNVWRIMKYTQGENDKNLTMKLCMPVFVHIENFDHVTDCSESEVEVEIKIMVALPPEFQYGKETAPKPTDKDLYIEDLDEFKCYVRNFSGFADETAFKIETEILRKLIKEANLLAIESKCICISYDPPYKLFNRKNEVIVISI